MKYEYSTCNIKLYAFVIYGKQTTFLLSVTNILAWPNGIKYFLSYSTNYFAFCHARNQSLK